MFTVAVTAARPPVPLDPPVDAVTVASRLVVMVVAASPWLLVMTTVDDNAPAVDVNETETPGRRLPSASKTTASSALVPPEAGTFDGLAVRLIEPAAAPPMSTDRSPEVIPPENARTTARPDRPPASRRTVALPSCVRASAGSIWPIVVVNVTSVPFWTCVPPDSMTVAVMSAAPLTGTIVVLLKRVTVDPVGAVSGTLSQPAEAKAAASPRAISARRDRMAGTGRRSRDVAGAIMAFNALTRIASCI